MKKAPARGRPRAFALEDALDRAIQVFRVKGYAATSISDLVSATGLNPPSLYAAFGSKRGMFLAALDRYVATVGQCGRTALTGARPDEAVSAFADAVVATCFDGDRGQGCLLACVAADAAGDDPAIRAATDRHMRGGIATLETARMGTTLPPGEVLMAAMHAAAVRARTGASRDEVRALVRRLVTGEQA
jgi:TetR/AcrR family transcriptional regulator, copper-responsive repressor